MKIKQIIAAVLIGAITAPFMPQVIYANTQSSITSISIPQNGITHKEIAMGVDGTTKIAPSVRVKWKAPKPIDGEGTDITNPDAKHDVEYYQIVLKKNGDKAPIRSQSIKPSELEKIGDEYIFEINGNTKFGFDNSENQINTSYTFDNGSVYEIGVEAVHWHYKYTEDNIRVRDKVIVGPIEKTIMVATDFDTEVRSQDQGLDVMWEYIPGANYKLTYAKGQKETKKDFEKNAFPPVKISAKEAKELYDSGNVENGKIVYRIDKLDPKQNYSVMVELEEYFTPNNTPVYGVIKNENTDKAGPKVVQGWTDIEFKFLAINQDLLELSWDSFMGAIESKNLKKIEVYAKEAGTSQARVIAEKIIGGGSIPRDIVIQMPKVKTEYAIRFIFDTTPETYVETKFQMYDPVANIVQTPLAPKVPKPFGPNVEITESNKKLYLVTGDRRLSVNAHTNPEFISNTFHAQIGKEAYVQLVWDAYKAPNDETMVDYDLVYDIWMSDNLDEIGDKDKEVIKNYQVPTNQFITNHLDSNEVLGFKVQLGQYRSDGVLTAVKANKTYYIQIVAKRKKDPNSEPESDKDFVISQPTLVTITVDKDGNIFQPPVLGKLPLSIKEEEVTEKSLVIEWLTKWNEVFAKDISKYDAFDNDEKTLAEIGTGVVYLSSAEPFLRFKGKENKLNLNDKTLQEAIVIGKLQDHLKKYGVENDFTRRKLALGDDVSYEINVMPYTELESHIGGKDESLIVTWLKETFGKGVDNSLITWEGITPIDGDKDANNRTWKEYEINKTTKGEALTPNTRYFIMIRAYRMVDGKKEVQTFPSYVVGTTSADYVTPEPKPVAPDLYYRENSKTDASFGVWWKYDKNFDYEIVYSTGDDSAKAQPLPFTIVDKVTDSNVLENKYFFKDGEEADVVIRGLFPETTYNVWIRAKQKIGTEVSEFSTPVTVRTEELAIPDIPTGLGPASAQSLHDLGLEFEAIGEDYITIEWTKNNNDIGTITEGTITKRYEYDIAFADDTEFTNQRVVTVMDTASTWLDVSYIAKNIIKYNNLRMNYPYYFKVKARVVWTDSATGKTLTKESEFSKTVKLATKKSSGEYDGGENDNIVTYPNETEQSYKDGVWQLELVDTQRIISDIATGKAYYYTIEMNLYDGRIDAVTRRLIIPINVMKALYNQKMELKVVTKQATYKIPAKAIGYAIENANAKDKLQIDFETILAYDLGSFGLSYPYALESAEQMKLQIQSVNGVPKIIEYFEHNIDVAMKLVNANSYSENNYKTYTYDYTKGRWVQTNGQIRASVNETSIGAKNNYVGIYALYKIDTYYDKKDVNYAMQQLTNRYNIPLIGSRYTQNMNVHSNQFINLLLQIALNKKDINLDESVTNERRQQANASRIYLANESGYVTQEQAVNGVIKLYEMRTGSRIQASATVPTAVSRVYRESVEKAYTIGLINSIEPKKSITYGELATLVINVLD
ncbi:MAG: fibronectin type III domain-containing protein [Cellulosilyticaceae bacterium]